MVVKCFYCGKEHESAPALHAHLRFCPVRRNGMKYNVGDRAFLVKTKSYRQLGLIQAISTKFCEIPDMDAASAFFGFLAGLKAAGKINSFELTDIGDPVPAATGPQQTPLPVSG